MMFINHGYSQRIGTSVVNPLRIFVIGSVVERTMSELQFQIGLKNNYVLHILYMFYNMFYNIGVERASNITSYYCL